ncbi:MAG: short-chain dehydrogenase [Robiginitomaculum sp.]|nr:MAG: short-chain dehydrogenase [Robiginitomaculum sp.]
MKDTVKKYGEWAVITGGSAGIGLAFAHELAAKGHNLVLVARGQKALDASALKLKAQHKIDVVTIAMDLTAVNAPSDLYEKTKDIAPGLVVLSAGSETTGHFTKVALNAHSNLINLNIQVPAALARLYGADMIQRGRGGIVFLSSLFGYQGVPLVANYAASQAYILTLGEALHVEMKPHGVDVLVVSPGLTKTNMPAQMPVDFWKMPITKHQPVKVARVGLRALGRKASVVPGYVNKVFAFENRFLPRLWPTKMFGFLLKNALYKDQKPKLLNAVARRS